MGWTRPVGRRTILEQTPPADSGRLAVRAGDVPSIINQTDNFGDCMVKLTVRERESIQEAVRRFRKLVERSGIKKEMRKREFFEKPSETRRRSRLRAERRMKRNRLLGV
jgi:small subunit ribosomal protein S21